MLDKTNASNRQNQISTWKNSPPPVTAQCSDRRFSPDIPAREIQVTILVGEVLLRDWPQETVIFFKTYEVTW